MIRRFAAHCDLPDLGMFVGAQVPLALTDREVLPQTAIE